MRYMGLDLGNRTVGIAFSDPMGIVATGYETYRFNEKDLQKVLEYVKMLVVERKVDKIVLEEVRPDKNITQSLKTHRALMWLQAAINFLVHENYPKITIDYTYPSEWRSACGIKNGRGVVRASAKELDIQFVKDTYGITVNDDIADAIGIGHAFVNQLESEINWE